MGYVDEVLAPGETIRLRARLHWLLWARAWAALIFLGIIIVGIVLFVRDVARLTTTEVAITNYRLIQKTGFLARHAWEVQLTSIEAVNVDQGVWGRLLGFGRVTVHGTGDDTWVTPMIADPLGFRRELESALAQVARAPRANQAQPS